MSRLFRIRFSAGSDQLEIFGGQLRQKLLPWGEKLLQCGENQVSNPTLFVAGAEMPTQPYSAKRRLFTETLETRAMLAGDLVHNFVMPHDVNDDGNVSAIDVLTIINKLNDDSFDLQSIDDQSKPDVNDDSILSALDALQVVNVINNPDLLPSMSDEFWLLGSGGARAQVELETEGSETELSIKLKSAEANQTYSVTLNDIALGELTTDSKGRGRIKLSRGDDNRSHLPLPDALTALTPAMELTIGQIVNGRIGNAFTSSSTGGSSASGNNSSDDNATGDDSTSNSGGSSSGSQQTFAQVELLANFSDSQLKAEYEVDERRGALERKFEVEIEDAERNKSYAVFVDGQQVATLVTDSRGDAKLKYSTSPRDARETMMPSDFPAIAEGTTVTIESRTATFRKVVA
ncbi:MAG: dockerin type I domain-containing protein [Pirellulaceae bacterium]